MREIEGGREGGRGRESGEREEDREGREGEGGEGKGEGGEGKGEGGEGQGGRERWKIEDPDEISSGPPQVAPYRSMSAYCSQNTTSLPCRLMTSSNNSRAFMMLP